MFVEAITASVHKIESVVDSAEALITGLAAQLKASASDPAAIMQLAAELDAKSGELAAAVAANTPSDPNAGQPQTTT